MVEVNDDPIQRCLEGIKLNAQSRGTDPKSTLSGYKVAIPQYLEFVNSETGLEEEITPEALIDEARRDIRLAQVRMQRFFIWLQGDDAPEDERRQVEAYEPWDRKVKQTSAAVKAYGTIRGFYTHNKVDFGKWSTPKVGSMVKDTIENDRKHPIFTYDPDEGYGIDYTGLRGFLDLLNPRDKAIYVCLVSSGQDSGDLFRLTLKWLRDQEDRKRLSWRGRRQKTHENFWTFISAEATRMLRQYVKIERADAADGEPIFATRLVNGTPRRMTSAKYSSILTDAAMKLGILPEGTTQHPFRAKRARHIYESACKKAKIPDDRVKCFMGHAGGIGLQYVERNLDEHEAVYATVEPYLTVYGQQSADELSDVSRRMNDAYRRISDMLDEVERQKLETDELREAVKAFESDEYLNALADRMVEKKLGGVIREFKETVKEIEEYYNADEFRGKIYDEIMALVTPMIAEEIQKGVVDILKDHGIEVEDEEGSDGHL